MKKYSAIFSSFHTLYRLATSLTDPKNFLSGVARLYKNILKVDKVLLVCKIFNGYGFIKIQLSGKKQVVKKGGISILSKRERDILKQNRELIMDNRMAYPFIFVNTLGVIYVKRKQKNDVFDDLEKKWFVAISEQVSVYLNVFNLYQEQKNILLGYIKSMGKVFDQHVPTSYIHTKSAFKLIKHMGKEMKLTETEIKLLEHASLLHDAGKLEIPTKLLKKESSLTSDEYKLIMKHPHKGAELIKDLKSLKAVVPIILHHHERWDGTGYPSKLSKEDIPLSSRILSVIDAFDAMFFGRPYKKRMSLENVEVELKKHAGKQFDPKVITVFLKILKKKSIRKSLQSAS